MVVSSLPTAIWMPHTVEILFLLIFSATLAKGAEVVSSVSSRNQTRPLGDLASKVNFLASISVAKPYSSIDTPRCGSDATLSLLPSLSKPLDHVADMLKAGDYFPLFNGYSVFLQFYKRHYERFFDLSMECYSREALDCSPMQVLLSGKQRSAFFSDGKVTIPKAHEIDEQYRGIEALLNDGSDHEFWTFQNVNFTQFYALHGVQSHLAVYSPVNATIFSDKGQVDFLLQERRRKVSFLCFGSVQPMMRLIPSDGDDNGDLPSFLWVTTPQPNQHRQRFGESGYDTAFVHHVKILVPTFLGLALLLTVGLIAYYRWFNRHCSVDLQRRRRQHNLERRATNPPRYEYQEGERRRSFFNNPISRWFRSRPVSDFQHPHHTNVYSTPTSQRPVSAPVPRIFFQSNGVVVASGFFPTVTPEMLESNADPPSYDEVMKVSHMETESSFSSTDNENNGEIIV